MKDQGKISELNQSSHRYQSSNTVGWTPVLRRLRTDLREQDQALATLSPNATWDQVQEALYPKMMEYCSESSKRRIDGIRKHRAYQDFMLRYGDVFEPKIFTKEDYDDFIRFYEDPFHYPDKAMFEKIMLRYNQWLCARAGAKPSVNLSQFPRASIPSEYDSCLLLSGLEPYQETVILPLEMSDSYPRYSIHTDVKRFDPLISESSLYTPQSGVLEACDSVSEMLDELVDSSTFAQLSDLCTFRRPLLSVVVLSLVVLAVQVFRYTVLTVNFLSGLLLGVLFGKPKLKYQYVPQASPLTSDDGLAFTGKKTASTSMPTSANAPGMSVSPTTGWGQTTPNSAQPRVAPPKQSKKDPNDGMLNGFGIGI